MAQQQQPTARQDVYTLSQATPMTARQSISRPGILRTPRSCLTSAGGAVEGAAPSNGLARHVSVDTFFLKLDDEDDNANNTNRGNSSSGSGGKQHKHAVFADTPGQGTSNGAPGRSLLSASQYAPGSMDGRSSFASLSITPFQQLRVDAEALTPQSARIRSKQQQRNSLSNGGSAVRNSLVAAVPGHDNSSLGSRQSSLLVLDGPSNYFSSSTSTPGSKPGGSGVLSSTGSPGASGCCSVASAKHYGTAWYLKTKDWDHVTHNVQHGSTWRRESVYLEELDEQHRFAQQLQNLSDPNSTSGDGTSSATPVAALAAVVQGLSSADGGKALAAISPAVLAANTWAMPKKDVMDEAAADAAMATAAVQHYKQLHEAAQQQAAMNEKVRGTYALRAYKDFMRSKGYRQAASLQRIPTPTDEDVRKAKVRQQQQLKRQQQRERLHGHKQPQQQHGSQLQQQIHQQQQQQQQSGDEPRPDSNKLEPSHPAAVGVAAAATEVPAAAAASIQQSSSGNDSDDPSTVEEALGRHSSILPSLTGVSSQRQGSLAGTAAAAAAAAESSSSGTAISSTLGATAVPKLDLAEVTRVSKQLQELKQSCHPITGLDPTDWHMLEALLTGGRQALLTAKAIGTSSGGGSSRSLPGSSSGSRMGTPGTAREPWQSYCGGSSSSRLQSRDGTHASPRRATMGSCSGVCSPDIANRLLCSADSPRASSSSFAGAASSAGGVLKAAAHAAVRNEHPSGSSSGGSKSPGPFAGSTSRDVSSSGSARAAAGVAGSSLLAFKQQHQQQRQQQLVEADQQRTADDGFDPDSIDFLDVSGPQPATKQQTQQWPQQLHLKGGTAGSLDGTKKPLSPAARAVTPSEALQCHASAAGGTQRQQPALQESPRLTSRGGAGRLSPYKKGLLEQMPLRINYTLTRGGSGPVTGGESAHISAVDGFDVSASEPVRALS